MAKGKAKAPRPKVLYRDQDERPAVGVKAAAASKANGVEISREKLAAQAVSAQFKPNPCVCATG